MGAAYGTTKSRVGVASMGVMRPELVMKSIVSVVMAGVLGIYGLIIAFIIGINPKAKSYYLFYGYAHLSSGLACGLAGLSAGMAIGIVGDAGVTLHLNILNEQAYRSLAVSNPVELFKFVFLNASTAPEVPNLLAETLRRYSEDDFFLLLTT
ncbi:V-type proton ATPase proteolipid subunit [Heracleum sosnowskyi]|uniref:V-type proton ATPase proteolipid subunit n=1 Tax=Heracleum sosnowskyi TaxID=360622 RepID=A0AAD8NAH6_9APIA|nr:V-type proton ATPase proteolipid subunit [Heracleum sosnowskyi]